jgi:hypothetical protein
LDIQGGVIVDEDLPRGQQEQDIEDAFLKWREKKATVTLVVKCHKSVEFHVRKAVEDAGGKVYGV